ncbi:family 43 glycosylhydrolase [Opitutaceae bacterium]|nr:family 43 glycosylhydrolase [Opitutaceae bacterium]
MNTGGENPADADGQPKLSAATKRAQNYTKGPEWFFEFRTKAITGDLAENEPGIVRRDPSAVIKVGDHYHVWYSKSVGLSKGFGTGDPAAKTFPWDFCDIWHATSADGWHWEEKGVAVERGAKGTYDERSVFTPEVLAHGGKYYLVYQVVEWPYVCRVFEHIAMAVADSPEGPWTKLPGPVVEASQDGIWEGDDDNRFHVKKKGGFDSHKVHDPCLIPFEGRFFLYYKGEPMGEEMSFGGREPKWGVAIADHIEGPYVKSDYNPVTNSGHEVCIWPYQGGIAALLTTDGPEKNTVQWAADGINFEIMAVIKGTPEALGLCRTPDHEEGPLKGIDWGLAHKISNQVGNDWGYIERFEADESPKTPYLDRSKYE